jgi:hypothetical protein
MLVTENRWMPIKTHSPVVRIQFTTQQLSKLRTVSHF